ncbi:MAG: heparinase II/III family protein [Gemmatimonadota bacterium]|nr:heparinase II/III family protein [Gemmatimonadota bacterium]
MMLICIVLALAILLCLIPQRLNAEPVFRPDVDRSHVAGLKKSMAPLMALSEDELARLIPDRSGFRFVDCPNCEGGAEENQLSWSIEDPHRVFCLFCGMRFPNEVYPENGVKRVTNARGEVQVYAYWEAPFPPPAQLQGPLSHIEPDPKYRHYFRAKGWYVAREYFSDAAHHLGKLYHLTENPAFARRAALILDRFAQVYPGYCPRFDAPFRPKVIFEGNRTFPFPVSPYLAAKWDYWAYGDIPSNLVFAYDLIRDSGQVDDGMRRRIEDDLIHGSVSFVRSYPITLSNMDPAILRGLISAGWVLAEPAYVHDAVQWITDLIRKQFFVDGMWREAAVSYHNQTVNGLADVMDLLDGYSDPMGYVHPESGARYESLDLSERFPLFEKARRIPDLLRYPNGRVVAVHDTWAREHRAPTECSGPNLLGGAGHAWLGRGSGTNQAQAHLHFSGAYGHAHGDLLSITLFAHGQERLSDIGYTWTHQRQWASSTLSHSTVVVNGEDQTRGHENDPSDGNLLLFVPGDSGFQAVAARGDRAYPGVVRDYQRLLVMIGVSAQDAYVVDVFRVEGGARHEYVLVGDANNDGSIETDLDRSPYGETLLPPDVKVVLPSGETVPGYAEGHNFVYAYVRDVRRADISAPWNVVFTSEGEPKGGVRIHGVSEVDGDLLFGSMPSVRRAEESEGRLDDYTMPALIHRREGKDLASEFVNVLEPFGEAPFLRSVEMLDSDSDGLALKIEGDDYTDFLLHSGEGRRVVAGDIVLDGRIGFVRERDGAVEKMTLVGGLLLQKGSVRLEGEGIFQGAILGVLRKESGSAVDGLVVDGDVPEGEGSEDLTVVVNDGVGFSLGLRLKDVIEREGQTILVLADDPGFEMEPNGTSRHVYFPRRTWTGENRYEIMDVKHRLNSGR